MRKNLCLLLTTQKLEEHTYNFSLMKNEPSIYLIFPANLILSAHEIFDDRTHVNIGIEVIWNVLQSSALWLLLCSLC